MAADPSIDRLELDACVMSTSQFGEDIIQILGYNPLPISLKINLYDKGFDSEKVNLLIGKYESNLLIDEIVYQGNYIDSIESRINLFIFIFLILVLLLIFVLHSQLV